MFRCSLFFRQRALERLLVILSSWDSMFTSCRFHELPRWFWAARGGWVQWLGVFARPLLRSPKRYSHPLPAGTVPKYRPDGNLNVNTLRPSQVPAALLSRLSSLYGLKPRRIHRVYLPISYLTKTQWPRRCSTLEI